MTPPASEKYQKVIGITDWRARSDMIHWIRKRIENIELPGEADDHPPELAPVIDAEDAEELLQDQTSPRPFGALGLLAPPDQPHHPDEVVDADQRPAQVGVVRPAGVARGVGHVDVQRPPAVAGDQRRQVAVHVVEVGQAEKDVAADELQPAAGVAGVVLEQRLRGCRWRPSTRGASRRCPGGRRAGRRPARRRRGSSGPRAGRGASGSRRAGSGRRRPACRRRCRGRSGRRCGPPPTGRRSAGAGRAAASGSASRSASTRAAVSSVEPSST